MDDAGFDLNATPDRAMALGIAALVVVLMCCGAAGTLGILSLPLWLVGLGLGGAAWWYGRRGLNEVNQGIWPEPYRNRANLGFIFGIISTSLSALALVLFVAMFGFMAVMLIIVLVLEA
jgi:hypothetical protein